MSPRRKIPNLLTRSIRRPHNMRHSKKSESNLKGGGWKDNKCNICQVELPYFVNGKENIKGINETNRLKRGWIHKQDGALGIECRAKADKNAKDAKDKKNQTKIATSSDTPASTETSAERRERQRREDASQRELLEIAKRVEAARKALEDDAKRVAEEKRLAKKAIKKAEENAEIGLFKSLFDEKDDIYDPLNQKIHQYYGSEHHQKVLTKTHADMIEDNRNKYIKLWNYYNVTDKSYDPLCPSGTLPDEIQKMRDRYSQYKNIKSNSDFTNEAKRVKPLYSGDEEEDKKILRVRKVFTYSIDSLNKHQNNENYMKPYTKYKFSPNSIEIHCTIFNDPDFGHDSNNPTNLKGHVSIIIIRDLSEDQQKDITDRSNTQWEKIKTKCTNFLREDYEKAQGETYHYGIYNDNTERWWKTGLHHAEFLTEGEMDSVPLALPPLDFFPSHNSAGILMKEYYLNCINNCPKKVTYQGKGGMGSSQVTYRDSTDWGVPRTLNTNKNKIIIDHLIEIKRNEIKEIQTKLNEGTTSSRGQELQEEITSLETEIQELERFKDSFVSS